MKTNSRIMLISALVSLLLASPALLAGKVYKWVDKEGNVHYSAEKPEDSGGAQEMKIRANKQPSAADEEQEESTAKSEGKKPESEAEKVKVSSEKEAAEVEKKNEEIRQRNCSVAKKRLASINAGGRLYEVDEKGERKFWDDSTTSAKRAEAEANVAEWCK